MRHRVSGIAAAALVVCRLCWAGLEPELQNGDFEQPAPDGRAPHWIVSPPGVWSITPEAHTGRQALRLEVKQASPPWPALQQFVKVQPRRTYRLTFWLKAEGLQPSTDSRFLTVARVIERDAAGQWARDPAQPDRPKIRDFTLKPDDPQDFPWRPIEITTTTEPGADHVQILIQLAGAVGRLWVDDVKLEPLAGLVGDWPKDRLDGRGFSQISREVATPHTVWARPWTKGKTRALFLVPKVGMREVVELYQRMDLDYDAVVAWHPHLLGLPGPEARWEGSSLVEKEHQLQGYLKKPYDAIVIGNFPWGQLNEEIRYAIFSQVHRGAGLVLVMEPEEPLRYELQRLFQQPTTSGREFLTAGFPFDRLRWGFYRFVREGVYTPPPRSDVDHLVRTYRLGQGRCICLGFPYPEEMKHKDQRGAYGGYGGTALTPFVTYTGQTLRHYEYYQVLLARAILWAAGKETPVHPRPGPLRTEAGRPTRLELAWEGPVEGREGLRPEWSLRDAWGVERAAGTGPVEVPALPAGPHVLEYRLRGEKGVVHFGAIPVEVAGATAVAHVEVLRGQPLQVKATIQGPGGRQASAELVDIHDRVVAKARAPVEGENVRLSLPVPPVVTALHRLDLHVLDTEARPLALAQQELFLAGAPRPDFNLCMWGSTDGTYPAYLQDWAYHRLWGVDGIYLTGGSMCIRLHVLNPTKVRLEQSLWPMLVTVGRTGAEPIPWLISVLGREKDHVRQPCLHDPRYLEETFKCVQAGAAFLGGIGLTPRFVTFGDEFLLTYPNSADVCFSPHSKQGFRQWVRGVYPDVGALNAEWGTAVKTWDEVEPITLETARQTGRHAQWVDHKLYMDAAMLQHLTDCTAIVRQHMKDTRVGYEGMFRSYTECGYDIERIFQVVDYLNTYMYPYRPVQFRGLSRPGTLTGMFCNGLHPGGGQWMVWRNLVHGMFHLFWWRADADSGCFSYDLTPLSYRAFPEVSREVQAVRRLGIDTLLLHAQRVQEPVALLYSQPSLHASKLYRTSDDILNATVSLVSLLSDLRVGYTMVGSAAVAEPGWWKPRQIRVLVLPYTQAIADPTAAGIRQFVREGGTLIADVRPACLDGHGKLRPAGALDEVFGIRRSGDVPLKEADGPEGLGRLLVDPAVSPSGATPQAGGLPILLTHTFGQGRTLLWNFLATAYDVEMKAADFNLKTTMSYRGNPALRRWMDRYMETIGLERQARLIGPARDLGLVETAKLVRHQTVLAAFARHYFRVAPEVTRVSIDLPESGHWYDVRAGRYLGQGRRVELDLPCGSGALAAGLAYRPQGLRIEASGAAPGGTLAVRAAVQSDNAGPKYHVVVMRVAGPDGQERPWYSRPIVINGQEGRATVPLALNDPVGRWRILARDAITGLEGECTVEVR